MSQRLCIGQTEDHFYDCVITDNKNIEHKILSEFLATNKGIILGPWKIRINDIDLYNKVKDTITETMELAGIKYPSGIWYFYYKDKYIDHPSEHELEMFIKKAQVIR